MITNADKENAKKVLGEVLDALHEKEYENICSVVDEVDLECTIVKRVDTFFKEKYLRTVA